MNIFKESIITAGLLICGSTAVFAQEAQAVKKVPAYGDNPNIIRVLAVKTQEKVVDVVERIGAATERGIAKVKPNVEKTWDKTKTLTTDTAKTARDKTVQTVTRTKEVVLGQNNSSAIPIESGSLSQSMTVSPAMTLPVAATPIAEALDDLPETPNTTTTVTETTIETQTIQQLPSVEIPPTPSQQSSTDSSFEGVPR